MKFSLKIECGGTAFCLLDDNNEFFLEPSEEVARLLELAASRVRQGYKEGSLLDVNGNSAGSFKFTGRR